MDLISKKNFVRSLKQFTQEFGSLLLSDTIFQTSILLIIFLIILMFASPTLKGEAPTFSQFINLLLVSVTTAMVIAIRNQVKAQESHLQNFEPSLRILSYEQLRYHNEMPEHAETTLQLLNDSQTSTYISSIKVKEIDVYAERFVKEESPDSTVYGLSRNMTGEGLIKAIHIPPNESKEVRVALTSNSGDSKIVHLTKQHKEKLKELEEITLIFEGNFETKEFALSTKGRFEKSESDLNKESYEKNP